MATVEASRREAAVVAFETEGNNKVQENMRSLLERGVIMVARPSEDSVLAQTQSQTQSQTQVVGSTRRRSLRSRGNVIACVQTTALPTHQPVADQNNPATNGTHWSWDNDDTSNDSFDSLLGLGHENNNRWTSGSGSSRPRRFSPAGPAFVKILLPKHVSGEFRVAAPIGLADFLPLTTRSVTLRCDGEAWRSTWSAGRDSSGACLAGNWRGFVEDQRLVAGDAVVLKKELGANLTVTIHRARGFETDGVGGSFGGGENDTHESSVKHTAAWRNAFAQAAVLTDAMFVNHGGKPEGSAFVAVATPSDTQTRGGGTDPATHTHSRRTSRDARRRQEKKPLQLDLEVAFAPGSLPFTAVPYAPFASPKPVEKTSAGPAVTQNAITKNTDNTSFLSPAATPAASDKTRFVELENAANKAGLRAPLRFGETRNLGSGGRNPLETPASASPGTCGEDGFEDRRDGTGCGVSLRDAKGKHARGVDCVETHTKRPARRQPPRFVSSATGAAPWEGWTTPRAAKLSVNTVRSSPTKRACAKITDYVATPNGAPLSRVFKSTKKHGTASAVWKTAPTRAFATPTAHSPRDSPFGADAAAAAAKRRRRG